LKRRKRDHPQETDLEEEEEEGAWSIPLSFLVFLTPSLSVGFIYGGAFLNLMAAIMSSAAAFGPPSKFKHPAQYFLFGCLFSLPLFFISALSMGWPPGILLFHSIKDALKR
jgi:hypothetical protein